MTANITRANLHRDFCNVVESLESKLSAAMTADLNPAAPGAFVVAAINGGGTLGKPERHNGRVGFEFGTNPTVYTLADADALADRWNTRMGDAADMTVTVTPYRHWLVDQIAKHTATRDMMARMIENEGDAA